MFVNYAHRGASHYAPENTLPAFYKGLEMGANGIETDVQRTRDGVLVLHHDDTLFRTVGIDKRVSEMTFAELRTLDFGAFFSEEFLGERIVTLEELLIFFGGKPVQFAIEIKQEGIETETLTICDQYLKRDSFIITSFSLESIMKLGKLKHSPKLGLLASKFDKGEIETLIAAGVGQYCPFAPELDLEQMTYLGERNFNIRAWGITDERVMLRALDMGVDGMTVNFPDKLRDALEKLR